MRSVLISIKPEWVEKILNGEKTIEIRKTAPKCELPIDVYIYCTLAETRDEILSLFNDASRAVRKELDVKPYNCQIIYDGFADPQNWRLSICNGKVVARFTLNKVEEIICRPIWGEWESYTKTLGYSEISQASCLGNSEIVRYLKGNNGYAWHISDLEIFREPKKLSEFGAKRAPQSWCYVEKKKDKKTCLV